MAKKVIWAISPIVLELRRYDRGKLADRIPCPRQVSVLVINADTEQGVVVAETLQSRLHLLVPGSQPTKKCIPVSSRHRITSVYPVVKSS
jgi:hypothetical protein